MHPQAIAGVLANELCQQQELYSALRGPLLYDRSRPTSHEAWEQGLEAAYWQGMASRIHVLDPVAMVQRCYTLYQSCVYEAIAREQEVELAPKRLVLRGQAEQSHFELRLNAKKHGSLVSSGVKN